MSSFFSGVDDASELGSPGMHNTYGGFGHGKKIQIAASIVNRGVRYCIDAHNYFDLKYINTIKPHENVWGQIEKNTFKYYPGLDVEIDEDEQPIFRKYTDELSQYVRDLRAADRKSTLDGSIDDISNELFTILTEAEGLGYISTEAASNYIDQFDDEFNALFKDSIPEIDKIAIMTGFCNELVKEIEKIRDEQET